MFYILTENSFYPKITLPTRFSKRRGTLIDNLFCKLTEQILDTTSDILTLKLSDHLPYFIFINNINSEETQLKYIKINLQTKVTLQSCETEIKQINLINKIDSNPIADPNINYNIIHDIINAAKNKHLPTKIVKFNKRKHKKSKWITFGIIKSINYRDKMYKDYK